jgi:hypothetical protein
MDAEKVFAVWRRILREEALSEAFFHQDFPARAPSFGLTPEEIEIALTYHKNLTGSRWAFEGYRFRMVRVAVYALQVGAPLTVNVLEASGRDMQSLARDFLVDVAWRDDGPFVYRTCADALAYLRALPSLAAIPALTDVMALESEAVALVRRLAELPAASWTTGSDAPAPAPGSRYQRTGNGVIVTTEHAIGPWLEDMEQAGKAPPEPVRQHLLVYLKSPAENLGYAVLSKTGKALLDALAEPRSLAEATKAIEPLDGGKSARALLRRFLELGVLRALSPALSG